MDSVTNVLFGLLLGLGPVTFVVVVVGIILVRSPEQIEKWAAITNKILAGIDGLFNSAHRKYVKYDLQSRINLFTKNVAKTAPYLEDTKIEIEWIEPKSDRKEFIDKGKAILRLRREDPEDLNFVHGAYWSVSTHLLPKVKRYISPSQRQALDLYVTANIIETQKYHVIEYFLEHYLHPFAGENAKVSELYDKFKRIDKHGVFYPLFLQELYFLSMKVYGKLKDEQIIIEVTRLIDFLERIAERTVGTEMETNFLGEYCKFGIVIIGKGDRMSKTGINPYVNYIKNVVSAKKVETIYVVGKQDYFDFINDVCDELRGEYEIYKSHRYNAALVSRNGESFIGKEYLIVLRAIGKSIYQPSR